jgi:hypothetical protein
MGTASTVTREELEAQFHVLQAEYTEHMESLKHAWLRENNTMRGHPECYEVMRDKDRQQVHSVMRSYHSYITPIAEKWWKDHGWTIHWPKDNSDPCQYTKD